MESSHSPIKRIFAFVAAAALLAATIYFSVWLFTDKGKSQPSVDEIAPYIEELKKESYFVPSDLQYTAASGCSGQKENSLLSIKSGLKYSADMIELNVSFDDEGKPFLADKSKDIDENSVPLSVAIEEILSSKVNPDAKILFNFKDMSGIKSINSLVNKYGLLDRALIIGVNRDNYTDIEQYCRDIPYYFDISYNPSASDEENYAEIDFASQTAAIGVRVDFKDFDEHCLELVSGSTSLTVFASGVNSCEDIDRALRLGVHNISTDSPEVMQKIFSELSP